MHLGDDVGTRFRRPIIHLLLSGILLGGLAGCSDNPAGPSTPTVTPAIAWVNLLQPIDLTPDGSIAVIQDLRSGGGDMYFYYTASGRLEVKTQVGDPGHDFATGVSANGVVTATHGVPEQAGFWTAASEWTDLPSAFGTGCDQNSASAWDISANGQSIVGLAWDHCNARAFRWDATGSGIMTPLQLLGESYPDSPNPPSNRASVISDDGSTIGGFASTAQVDRYPAIWRADGTGFLIPGVPDGYPGEVLAISADGKVAAGTVGADVFRWSEATGLVDIGQLPDADQSWANAIAADGKLIFGVSGSPWFGVPHAFVWTSAGGMKRLDDVAKAAGITISDDYSLVNVLAASQDGTVVLGTAYGPNFSQVTFVMHLPVSAYGL
jgi:uncharacterized membrane protein